MKNNDTIKLYISKDLVKSEHNHPEPYGEKIVILKNDMWTDVYEDENGDYYTFTNDEKLIAYIKSIIK